MPGLRRDLELAQARAGGTRGEPGAHRVAGVGVGVEPRGGGTALDDQRDGGVAGVEAVSGLPVPGGDAAGPPFTAGWLSRTGMCGRPLGCKQNL